MYKNIQFYGMKHCDMKTREGYVVFLNTNWLKKSGHK